MNGGIHTKTQARLNHIYIELFISRLPWEA